MSDRLSNVEVRNWFLRASRKQVSDEPVYVPLTDPFIGETTDELPLVACCSVTCSRPPRRCVCSTLNALTEKVGLRETRLPASDRLA